MAKSLLSMISQPSSLLIALAIVSSCTLPSISAQSAKQKGPTSRASGTCAVTGVAPFGEALTVDSRVTVSDNEGRFVRQLEGCKLRIPKPSILLVGTGEVESTEQFGNWKSLDAAEAALSTLPENPTPEQMDAWGESWGKTLARQYLLNGKTPHERGAISELLLLTVLDGKPIFYRSTVAWDGSNFKIYTDQLHAYERDLQYSGACRVFVTHNSDDGATRIAGSYATPAEKKDLNFDGNRVKTSKTSAELLAGVEELEDDLTKIDQRAVIGPPNATAYWNAKEKAWAVTPNPACLSLPEFSHTRSHGQ